MSAPTGPIYDVDLPKVLQRLLSLGGEIKLHTELAMHAVALEDAHADLAERDARIAELEADKPAD